MTYKPDTDKRARLIAQSDLFAGGSVRLPRHAPWLEEFVAELLAFPGRHDDQVDALTQGLAWGRRSWSRRTRTYAVPGFISVLLYDVRSVPLRIASSLNAAGVAAAGLRDWTGLRCKTERVTLSRRDGNAPVIAVLSENHIRTYWWCSPAQDLNGAGYRMVVDTGTPNDVAI